MERCFVLRTSPYSVRMLENTDPKKPRIWALKQTVNMIMRISTIAADFLFYLSHQAKGIHSKSQLEGLFHFYYGWMAFIFF